MPVRWSELVAWVGERPLCKNARYVGVVVQWDRMPVSDAGDEGSSPSCAVLLRVVGVYVLFMITSRCGTVAFLNGARLRL